MRIAYLNKKFIALHKAQISILDRGFLYGDGAFETMRSYNGVTFLIERHTERLFSTLRRLRIHSPVSQTKMKETVTLLLKKNKLKNAYVKAIVTRGTSGGLLLPPGKIKPTVAVYALPYSPPQRRFYEKGIKLGVLTVDSAEKSRIAGNKTLNYLGNVLHRYEAMRKGFDDAVLVDAKGFVTEATSSNVFIVGKKDIITPSLASGILAGITRSEVIRILRTRLKLNVKEALARRSALYEAREIFLTNSLAEIVPAVKVGKHTVGRGKPGPVYYGLINLYKDAVRRYTSLHI